MKRQLLFILSLIGLMALGDSVCPMKRKFEEETEESKKQKTDKSLEEYTSKIKSFDDVKGILEAIVKIGDTDLFDAIVDFVTSKFNKTKDELFKSVGSIHFIAVENGQIKIFDHLITKYKFPLGAKNNGGYNALLCAAAFGQIAMFDHLVKAYSFSLDAKDNIGNNALLCAATYGWIEMFDHLITKYKFPLDAKNNGGYNALLCAVAFGRIEIVDHLVKTYNFLLDAKSDRGNGVLHLACLCKQYLMIKHLLAIKGISARAKNNNGQMAHELLEAPDNETKEEQKLRKELLVLLLKGRYKPANPLLVDSDNITGKECAVCQEDFENDDAAYAFECCHAICFDCGNKNKRTVLKNRQDGRTGLLVVDLMCPLCKLKLDDSEFNNPCLINKVEKIEDQKTKN